MVISGIGGLGHMAVQYAIAMGMRVAAVDVADDKLELAKNYGVEVLVNAREGDPVQAIQDGTGGGAHGVVVTAVQPTAFGQAIGMARGGGTIVLKGLMVRGSIVGTRQDMVEALDFYARGKVKPRIHERRLEDINDIFEKMKGGKIDGRVVGTF